MFLSCIKISENPEFYQIKLTDKTVVGLSPDSLQIEKIKEEFGEDDFYTVADDVMWYNAKMLETIDSLNIKYIHTNNRLMDYKSERKN